MGSFWSPAVLTARKMSSALSYPVSYERVALPVSAVLLVAMRRVRSGYLASGLYQGPGPGP